MMKMPKPKPVVRWMKLAPMLSRNMDRTILTFVNIRCKDTKITGILPIFANIYELRRIIRIKRENIICKQNVVFVHEVNLLDLRSIYS